MASVLVVGGGVAGLQVATDLVRLGDHRVWLVERSPWVGGKLHDLERTFPSDDCSLCHMAPDGCFLCVKSLFPPSGFPGLRVLTGTEVVAVSGGPGSYRVTVRGGEGVASVLPEPFGAVVLAPGCVEFDPTGLERLRYDRHPDVLTASRYEEMLAAGRLERPSGRGPVTRVAWVQCVGSRDATLGRPLCSTVCCGYAVKQAAVTRDLSRGTVQTTIFAQDLRAPDVNLSRYVRRVVRDKGVRVIRHRVHSIDLDEEDRLCIRFAGEDGTVAVEPFDLVVLSVGLGPDPQATRLARLLGLTTDEFGFCPSEAGLVRRAGAEGVFVAGSVSGPKDVSASLTEASSAALACHVFLSSLEPARAVHPLAGGARGMRGDVRPAAPCEGPGTEAPVGVLICRCPRASGAEGFAAELGRRAGAWPQVGAVVLLDRCPLDGDTWSPHAIPHRRLVLAACNPRACEAALQAAASGASVRAIQAYAPGDGGAFASLPLQEVEAALRASLAPLPCRPDPGPPLPAAPAGPVLVVGGGAAGLSCALALADLGVPCHVVERESSPGGRMLATGTGSLARDLRYQLQEMVERASGHPLIDLHLRCEIYGASRTPEGWQVEVGPARQGGAEARENAAISCSAVVVATGGEPVSLVPGLAQTGDEAVVTLSQLEELIASGIPPLSGDRRGPVVIVLCGEDGPPGYCSKVCCLQAVRCGLALKRVSPGTDVLVLFRDICTPGRAELEYNEARRRGVRFVRLLPGSPPELRRLEGSPGGSARLALAYFDPVLGEQVSVLPGLVAVASGIRPPGGLGRLAGIFGVPLDGDGFVTLRHPKVRPVETPVPGVFACGSVSGPATTPEALVQGRAAATRVATFLRDRTRPGRAACILGACSGCLTCLRVCPAGAIRLEDRRPRVDPSACRGCGICAAECPARAIVPGYTAALEAEVAALTRADDRPPGPPPVVVFACSHCASTAVERSQRRFPPGTRVLGVPCVGAVEESLMLKALALGARGVLLAGCRGGQCHYGAGLERARKRARRVKELLAQTGAEEGRVEVLELTPDRSGLLVEALEAMSGAREMRVCADGR